MESHLHNEYPIAIIQMIFNMLIIIYLYNTGLKINLKLKSPNFKLIINLFLVSALILIE